MIHREDPYGWGVSYIPMSRDVAADSPDGAPGHPVADTGRDLPWRLMGFSLLLSLLTLSGVVLLHRALPEPQVEPLPPPVEIAVRILPDAPELPPEPVQVVPKPPPPPQPVKTEPEPEPKPEPLVAAKPEPEPKPEPLVAAKPEPEPKPVIVPPPRPPVEKPVVRREPESAPVRPVPTQAPLPEATFPVAPPVAEYQREAPQAELSEKTATFAPSDQPAKVAESVVPNTAERRPAQVALPDESTVSLGTYSRADVAPPSTGASAGGRVRNRSARNDLSGSPVEVQVGGRDVDLPAPTGSSARSRRDVPRQALTGGPKMAKLFAAEGAMVSLPGSREGNVSKPQTTETRGINQSFERLDRLDHDQLDPSVAMSLSRLRTCRDPEAEMTLKSRLAAMLGNPTRCRSGGVVFDIRNAESAYSTHIDIYNYEGREFKDRCAALQVAIDACAARR